MVWGTPTRTWSAGRQSKPGLPSPVQHPPDAKKNTIDPIPFAGDPTAIFLPFLHSLLWINQGLKMIPKKIIAAPD